MWLLQSGQHTGDWHLRRQVRSMRHGNVYVKMELLERLVIRTRLINFGDIDVGDKPPHIFTYIESQASSISTSLLLPFQWFDQSLQNACDDNSHVCDTVGTSRADFHRFSTNSEIKILRSLFWKSNASCEWAPYRQNGVTNGYRCKCNDGYYGWKCELRLIFLLKIHTRSFLQGQYFHMGLVTYRDHPPFSLKI